MAEPADAERSPDPLLDLLLMHPDLDGFLAALAALLAERLTRVLDGAAVSGCTLQILRSRRQPVQATSAARPGQEPGAASVASVPVPGVEPADAVLTCYSARPGAFGKEAVRAVEQAAVRIGPALALSLRLDAQTHRANNLQAALESRTVVDLAAGIIMGQNNCSQERAVEILRSVSNSRNVKIRDVASGVVAVVTDRVSTHFEE